MWVSPLHMQEYIRKSLYLGLWYEWVTWIELEIKVIILVLAVKIN